MELLSTHGVLLVISLMMLIALLLVKQKRTIHLVFALFCGSIAMMTAKQLGSEQFGAYQYLVGMGACATCNGFWLVSRALFREKNAISLRHILAASSVGLLLIVGQALDFAQSFTQSDSTIFHSSRMALYELLNLFSSCMLILTAWEGCRALRKVQGAQLWQRILFLSSYCSAVLLCTVFTKLQGGSEVTQWLTNALPTLCAIQIILVTQILIYWRFQQNCIKVENKTIKHSPDFDGCLMDSSDNTLLVEAAVTDNQVDKALANQIAINFKQHKIYLQTNLKVADLARRMDVSEYLISRVLREHFNARNFNQFINEMRIEHAKTLLCNIDNIHWPIVVVAMESGFASVGPFTRAFK